MWQACQIRKHPATFRRTLKLKARAPSPEGAPGFCFFRPPVLQEICPPRRVAIEWSMNNHQRGGLVTKGYRFHTFEINGRETPGNPRVC